MLQLWSHINFNTKQKSYNYQENGLNKLENIAIITSSETITSHYTYDSFTKTVDQTTTNYETLRIKELNIQKTVNNITTDLMKFTYTYDSNNNITSITRYDNGSLTLNYVEFFYYNDLTNALMMHELMVGSDYVITSYTYDERGNITNISRDANGVTSTISLTYSSTGWLDQLQTITKGGVTYNVSNYQTIGNPLNYRGYTVTYDQRSITGLFDGINTYLYSYNANGIRTSKTVNGVITTYKLEDSKIIQEVRFIDPEDYDGNIILDYYYDTETGFYYLNSRYYDALIGRFINADTPEMILYNEINIYAYCENNPINLRDDTGYSSKIVGIGIQLYFNNGPFGIGLELVWFTSEQVNTLGQSRTIPFVYFFSEIGWGGSGNSIQQMLSSMLSRPSSIFRPKNFLKGLNASISFFVIIADETFTSPRNYEGIFRTVSGTAKHLKGYVSTSIPRGCISVGFGYHTRLFAASISVSNYWLISGKYGALASLFNQANKNAMSSYK